MGDPSRIKGEQLFEDTVTFAGNVNHKAGSVVNATIGATPSDPIDGEKVEREFTIGHSSAIGSAVAAFSEIKHIAQAAGEVVDVEIVCETIATGDNTLTVDVEKWNGSSWVTLLAADEAVNSSYTANTPKVITLAATKTYADGNLIRITGVLSGSTGAHAQGVRVQARLREKP